MLPLVKKEITLRDFFFIRTKPYMNGYFCYVSVFSCKYPVNSFGFCKFLSEGYPDPSLLALFPDVVSRESLFMYASYPLISTKMPYRKNPQFMNAKIPPIFSTS